MRSRPVKKGSAKHEPAENRAMGVVGSRPEAVDMDGNVGSLSHKKNALRYQEGKSRAGKNDQAHQAGAGSPNGIGEFVDLARKAPYGGGANGWARNTGKLGNLDPQETDQPSWVNTWSPHNTGPGGAGVTIDENYGAIRPRTQSRQEARFRAFNPEFQEGCGDGDWTNLEWSSNV